MIREYSKYKPFRFWCQKVLPLVYDDSLSYYELLNKVVDYLNNVIKDVNALGTAFEELNTMVTDYFENLDVQEEIDNKLDSMVEDGTLDAMIQPLVGDAVSEWLEDNVTPTGSAVVVDTSLTISGAAADAKVTGEELSSINEQIDNIMEEVGMSGGGGGASGSLDDIAFGGKTYRDIFETNNLFPYGDFENGLDWITASTNNPTISTEAYTSQNHSLKCFGASSSQIRKDIVVPSTTQIAVLCNVRVDRYVSGGGAGFVFHGSNILINHVTNGFETLYWRNSYGGTLNIFVGTISSANCDAYIDDFTVVDLTSVFGEVANFPTQTQLTELYHEWINIKNSTDDTSRIDRLENDVDYINDKLSEINVRPIFVGAIMGASSSANRFAAMRELYTVAQKVIDDPTYETSAYDLTYANYGAVCVLPQRSTAMYQKYPFDILYSKNGTSQAIPASTTKVMTLVTGLDYIADIYERITIDSADIQDGSSSILQTGDIVTINDLIYAMLLNSSNTAAMAFARISGEKILKSKNGEGTYTATQCQDAFVAEFAVKADNLGMTNTTFVSPSGRSESNLTTVEDMLRFTIEACSYPIIEKVWNKKQYTIAVKGDNARNVDIQTTVTDSTLESLYYVFGGKTGTLTLNQTSIALVMVAQAK